MAFALSEALALLERDPAAAAALARARLADEPADPDAITVLGSALRRTGELAAARAALGPLATSDAAPWAARFEWGELLAALGETRASLAPFERAVAANPGLSAAWRRIGDLKLVAGDVAGAEVAFDRMLASAIPDARLRAPALALAEGRPGDAEAALRGFLEREPSSLPAAHLMAETLAKRGQLAPAEALLAHCAAAAPGFSLARLSRALVLQRLGRHGEALAELDAALARYASNVRAQMAKGVSLAALGDHAGACVAIETLLAAFPDQPNAWLLHGNALRTLGRTEDALTAWRRCLALDAGFAEAWWAIANLKADPLSTEDRAEIEAQLTDETASPAARSLLAFALGKALEDAGRDADAFARYAEANALQHAARPYDADATAAAIAAARAAFTAAFLADRPGWGAPDPAPIFVVGMPRSGSTLVEQILASHAGVEGVGELADIQQMAAWVAAQAGGVAALPRAAVRQLGFDYLARTAPRRRLGRAYFVDKAPWNFLDAGLICLILPGARIVDVRRHPLACGFSCFRQHFAGGFDFAYDLADIGRYYAGYVDLMAQVDTVAPGRVRRVIYEDLVADPEGETRRLLAGLGLPFDAATLRFFENRRPVATPSSEQVRRPIYTEGLDHWRRFEPWLDPLKAALGPALETWRG